MGAEDYTAVLTYVLQQNGYASGAATLRADWVTEIAGAPTVFLFALP